MALERPRALSTTARAGAGIRTPVEEPRRGRHTKNVPGHGLEVVRLPHEQVETALTASRCGLRSICSGMDLVEEQDGAQIREEGTAVVQSSPSPGGRASDVSSVRAATGCIAGGRRGYSVRAVPEVVPSRLGGSCGNVQACGRSGPRAVQVGGAAVPRRGENRALRGRVSRLHEAASCRPARP